MNASAAEGDVNVLVFDVGGTRYGADASAVIRIESPRDVPSSPCALGISHKARRALVVRTEHGERAIAVDLVAGVTAVPQSSLRRMPAASCPRPHTLGIWLDGDRPVLLVDLAETLEF